MHSILRTSARLDLLPTGGQVDLRPAEFDTFVVDDRSGRAIGRATMRVDVCPITKTILGLELAPDLLPTARSATVAASEGARKRKTASRKARFCPMPGMPRTVVIDCPEFDAPTFCDVAMKLGETGTDPEA